jgi:cell division protease FtsH
LGDVKSAEIEMIDGQYVVSGTYASKADKKALAAKETLDEDTLKEGSKFKAITSPGTGIRSELEQRNVPTETIVHDDELPRRLDVITIDDMQDLIEQDRITQIAYLDATDVTNFYGTYKVNGKLGTTEIPFYSQESTKHTGHIIKQIDDAEPKIKRYPIEADKSGWFSQNLMSIAIFGLFALMFLGPRFMSKGMGGATHKKYMPGDPELKVRFDDVQGIDHAKSSVQQIVRYLKDPEKLMKMGAQPPKGALLMGPPGTGKTMLAKAVAAEADVPFISISGSDFIEMFVGVGAKRARALFDDAKKSAPCVIFIDEIDAIGGNRGNSFSNGGSEQQQTLTQMLTAMDGFGADSGVVVLAATNRPESLDPALMRAGRFDRKIEVNVPDLAGRVAILEQYLKTAACTDDIDVDIVAKSIPNASGADIKNLVNEALMLAEADGRDAANMADFTNARDNIRFGAKKNFDVTEDERRLTCDHEAGHATVMKFTKGSNPILKATAVPRANALGMVETYANGDMTSYNKQQLLALMDAFMGGRLAEEICHGEDYVTTGASHDIKMATYIAREMVLKWGFSKFGMQNFTEEQQATFLSAGSSSLVSMSNEQQIELDQEINNLISASNERARVVLEMHRAEHQAISNALFDYESISGAEIDTLCEGGLLTRKPTEASNDNKAAAPKSTGEGKNKPGDMQMRLG